MRKLNQLCSYQSTEKERHEISSSSFEIWNDNMMKQEYQKNTNMAEQDKTRNRVLRPNATLSQFPGSGFLVVIIEGTP